ncbi:septum formation initiator family protein [Alkalibacter mobilis]|uniref:septum formation initiator family protein n=1 Tax=Alkalibacter mobilis TaxID=2787712 RepID=UPI00189D105D|nr:septum formation initiator family protein [Alkalibacter mobilis]MBF7097123.1 septum formation initiator family protein [Alkalibacter mobilis]
MVISEKKLYNYYLEDDNIAITRIRNKYEKKRRIKGSSKIKCILFVLVLFMLGLSVLFQYSRINAVNKEIIALENDLKEIQMINDSKEGQILSSLDLNYIETYAKDTLGMVSPENEQYTYMAINQGYKTASIDKSTETASNAESKLVSWIVNLIN